MTKQEYIQHLSRQLSYYQGNHQDIIDNYSDIIDELLDEGLTMQDIIQRLGRPASLVEEIADEFNLQYTEQTIKETSMPRWAKILLITVLMIILIPSILSIVFGAVGTLLGLALGVISILFGGVFSAGALWNFTGLSTGFKLIGTLTGVMAIITCLIITYFIIHYAIRLVRYCVTRIRDTSYQGRSL